MEIQFIPLITGLVAVSKKIGLPSKYSPLLAVLLGIILVAPNNLTVSGFAMGAFYGLSAVGLWEVGKLPTTLK